MKNSIQSKTSRAIYNALYAIDTKLGKVKPYDYEDAPYCGHHKSGHKGKLTESSYHEGEGGGFHSNYLFSVSVDSDRVGEIKLLPNVQNWWYFTQRSAKTYFPCLMGALKAMRISRSGRAITVSGLAPFKSNFDWSLKSYHATIALVGTSQLWFFSTNTFPPKILKLWK